MELRNRRLWIGNSRFFLVDKDFKKNSTKNTTYTAHMFRMPTRSQ